jgi:hypothetical protein
VVWRSNLLACALLVTLALVAAFGATASWASPAAGVPGVTTCKSFVATKWTNPYPPNEVGDHYQILVSGKTFTCKTAFAFVKKFVAEKIKLDPKLRIVGLVTGGPSGFVCSSGIGKTGTAYQGHCMVKHPTPSSSWFSWGPYKDS